jgi:hypothetical protein
MSKSKCLLLSCGIDATTQAKLARAYVEILTKRKREGFAGEISRALIL